MTINNNKDNRALANNIQKTIILTTIEYTINNNNKEIIGLIALWAWDKNNISNNDNLTQITTTTII